MAATWAILLPGAAGIVPGDFPGLPADHACEAAAFARPWAAAWAWADWAARWAASAAWAMSWAALLDSAAALAASGAWAASLALSRALSSAEANDFSSGEPWAGAGCRSAASACRPNSPPSFCRSSAAWCMASAARPCDLAGSLFRLARRLPGLGGCLRLARRRLRLVRQLLRLGQRLLGLLRLPAGLGELVGRLLRCLLGLLIRIDGFRPGGQVLGLGFDLFGLLLDVLLHLLQGDFQGPLVHVVQGRGYILLGGGQGLVRGRGFELLFRLVGLLGRVGRIALGEVGGRLVHLLLGGGHLIGLGLIRFRLVRLGLVGCRRIGLGLGGSLHLGLQLARLVGQPLLLLRQPVEDRLLQLLAIGLGIGQGLRLLLELLLLVAQLLGVGRQILGLLLVGPQLVLQGLGVFLDLVGHLAGQFLLLFLQLGVGRSAAA